MTGESHTEEKRRISVQGESGFNGAMYEGSFGSVEVSFWQHPYVLKDVDRVILSYGVATTFDRFNLKEEDKNYLPLIDENGWVNDKTLYNTIEIQFQDPNNKYADRAYIKEKSIESMIEKMDSFLSYFKENNISVSYRPNKNSFNGQPGAHEVVLQSLLRTNNIERDISSQPVGNVYLD